MVLFFLHTSVKKVLKCAWTSQAGMDSFGDVDQGTVRAVVAVFLTWTAPFSKVASQSSIKHY